MTRYSATLAPITSAVAELRGDPDAARRVLAAVGLESPARPNTALSKGDAAVLWLGPKRWLVFDALAREAALATTLGDAALREPLALATIVTDMLAGLALRGPGTRDVLAQGTPLDLETLTEDAATMTDLFMIPALIRRAADGFDVWVDRSLLAYVEECLRVANGEEK